MSRAQYDLCCLSSPYTNIHSHVCARNPPNSPIHQLQVALVLVLTKDVFHDPQQAQAHAAPTSLHQLVDSDIAGSHDAHMGKGTTLEGPSVLPQESTSPPHSFTWDGGYAGYLWTGVGVHIGALHIQHTHSCTPHTIHTLVHHTYNTLVHYTPPPHATPYSPWHALPAHRHPAPLAPRHQGAPPNSQALVCHSAPPCATAAGGRAPPPPAQGGPSEERCGGLGWVLCAGGDRGIEWSHHVDAQGRVVVGLLCGDDMGRRWLWVCVVLMMRMCCWRGMVCALCFCLIV